MKKKMLILFSALILGGTCLLSSDTTKAAFYGTCPGEEGSCGFVCPGCKAEYYSPAGAKGSFNATGGTCDRCGHGPAADDKDRPDPQL